ncbi:MAG: hypothetical protein ACHP9U_06770, partial [Steroidobacterales bacterium]
MCLLVGALSLALALACPAPAPAQLLGSELPDERAWELVSPPQMLGALIAPLSEFGAVQAAGDGHAITYLANVPVEASPPGAANQPQVLSTRSGAGWGSRDIAPPHERAPGVHVGAGAEYRIFSSDLSRAVLQPFGLFNALLSPDASESTAYLRTLGACESSCYEPLVTGKSGFANVPPGTAFGEEQLCEPTILFLAPEVICGPRYRGASEDLKHIVLNSETPLSPGAGREELYEWSEGALSEVSLLAANEKGEELPAPEGRARLGRLPNGGSAANSRRAVSRDGSRVFWELRGGALYMRDTSKHRTLQLDRAEAACLAEVKCQSGGGEFQIASADGSKVYFTDAKRLTKDAGAELGKPDLYECQIEEAEGEPACRLSDVTPPREGQSADVLGAVLGASEDGSY